MASIQHCAISEFDFDSSACVVDFGSARIVYHFYSTASENFLNDLRCIRIFGRENAIAGRN
jgi:hypothetical protein